MADSYRVGYKVTRRATLQVGYRRLYFDRRDGTSFGLDTTMEELLGRHHLPPSIMLKLGFADEVL